MSTVWSWNGLSGKVEEFSLATRPPSLDVWECYCLPR